MKTPSPISARALFCDGGVVAKNPSPIGGTWAACLVSDGKVIASRSGVLFPEPPDYQPVSNNVSEMLALVNGLDLLPSDWTGAICSDSQITLGRAFSGWKWTGIPAWLYHEFGVQRSRLTAWDILTPILLAGHPTRAQLAAGVGRHGYPVSEHNVWCDHRCNQISKALQDYLAIQAMKVEANA